MGRARRLEQLSANGTRAPRVIRQKFNGDRAAWRDERRKHPPIIGTPTRYLALLEAAIKAAKERMTVAERLKTLFNRGFWTNLFEVVLPKLEARRDAARRSARVEYTEKDAALVKAGAALMRYKSRGKGRGSREYQYGHKAGKYLPHQGARECARRRGEIGAAARWREQQDRKWTALWEGA